METRTINYDGNSYPAVAIKTPKGMEVTIADMNLWNAIKDGYNWEDKDAVDIDNSIFYYVDNLEHFPTDEKLMQHLSNNTEIEDL